MAESKEKSDAAGAGSMAAALRRAQPYLDASWQFVGSVGLLTLVGWWLDGRLGTRPWLLVAGALVGLALGLYSFLRTVLRLAAAEPKMRFAVRPPPDEPREVRPRDRTDGGGGWDPTGDDDGGRESRDR